MEKLEQTTSDNTHNHGLQTAAIGLVMGGIGVAANRYGVSEDMVRAEAGQWLSPFISIWGAAVIAPAGLAYAAFGLNRYRRERAVGTKPAEPPIPGPE